MGRNWIIFVISLAIVAMGLIVIGLIGYFFYQLPFFIAISAIYIGISTMIIIYIKYKNVKSSALSE